MIAAHDRYRGALILAPLILIAAACTSVDDKHDYDLQWNDKAARLVVLDDTGKPLPVLDGKYLALPGFVLSRGQIRLHPGKQHIGYMCPQAPEAITVLDLAPSLTYDFKAGEQYELACIKGFPRIRLIDGTKDQN